MSLSTRPIFYFDYVVDENNFAIDFDEGIGELQASLNVGSYTPTDLATEVARAMSLVGNLVYTCTFDRDTRLFTISSTSAFDLLFSTGTRVGVSASGLLGFLPNDFTTLTSYEGTVETGETFEPQFFLQDFLDFDDIESINFSATNESGSGIVEVISFGRRNSIQFNIKYQTNRQQSARAPIENDSQGVENLRTFMKFAITKAPIEFMKDKNNRSNFDTIFLERAPGGSRGTGYKLKELGNEKLDGFYQTGNLRFRRVT